MLEFRKGNLHLLIATDIIARGVEIRSVGLIINYNCPIKYDKLVA